MIYEDNYNQNIVLVDKEDKVIGYDTKLNVHKLGKLHRAFSIIILNTENEMLIQRRALSKYHSGGLWSNACCSHAKYNEYFHDTIHKRLIEELGLDCDINLLYKFDYYHEFNNGLIENELDYVFLGITNKLPKINTNEILEYKWIKIKELHENIKNNSDIYTVWFKLILNNLKKISY